MTTELVMLEICYVSVKRKSFHSCYVTSEFTKNAVLTRVDEVQRDIGDTCGPKVRRNMSSTHLTWKRLSEYTLGLEHV